ncbi:hypothetical protein GQ44DRAFT_699117 [Phaeosphaeriaceae sp. PMI808]|nr:hypothetical protein GQ44DRAFT_699117 [Phaeosphaeriaceae sp. PMI808]
MGRAGWLQADVVISNLLAMIQDKKPSRVCKPDRFIEGSISLTLGKTQIVVYRMDESGSDVMVSSRNRPLDLGIGRAWKEFGVDPKTGYSPVAVRK